ncbi:MAG: GNAT family N-acetyltransferase, partial [Muribaculaceae bacterium]|nr:GNAT family N-acetyltransferase [Muribaculaceae bacterium]
MIDIQRYTPALQQEWDEFAAASRNGTFLHRRAYMDYHADRFSDHSLMARDGSGRLLAVLPAHAETDGTLASHRGLTYGAWLMAPRHCTAATMIEIFEALAAYMRAQGFRRLLYRPVPHIYHNYPAEDDIYALWRMGAAADAINASTTIDLS